MPPRPKSTSPTISGNGTESHGEKSLVVTQHSNGYHSHGVIKYMTSSGNDYAICGSKYMYQYSHQQPPQEQQQQKNVGIPQSYGPISADQAKVQQINIMPQQQQQLVYTMRQPVLSLEQALVAPGQQLESLEQRNQTQFLNTNVTSSATKLANGEKPQYIDHPSRNWQENKTGKQQMTSVLNTRLPFVHGHLTQNGCHPVIVPSIDPQQPTVYSIATYPPTPNSYYIPYSSADHITTDHSMNGFKIAGQGQCQDQSQYQGQGQCMVTQTKAENCAQNSSGFSSTAGIAYNSQVSPNGLASSPNFTTATYAGTNNHVASSTVASQSINRSIVGNPYESYSNAIYTNQLYNDTSNGIFYGFPSPYYGHSLPATELASQPDLVDSAPGSGYRGQVSNTNGMQPTGDTLVQQQAAGMIPDQKIVDASGCLLVMPTNMSMMSSAVLAQGFNPLMNSANMKFVWHGHFETLFQLFSPHKWTFEPTVDVVQDQSLYSVNDSAKVRFLCEYCCNAWTSMKGRVTFWYTLDQIRQEGRVYFKLFGQKCQKCQPEKFEHAMWYPEEVRKVLYNLYLRVGSRFYGLTGVAVNPDRRPGRPRTQHNSSLCQACASGICREASATTTSAPQASVAPSSVSYAMGKDHLMMRQMLPVM